MKTKVSEQEWKSGIENLNARRQSSPGFERRQNDAPAITDYANHLKKIEVGASVLDVGCGDCSIRNYLPTTTAYTGIDAFPINELASKAKIEDFDKQQSQFDTVICFACLDGVQDLKKATANMKRLAKKNVYILTGIGIEIDKFHTFKITESGLMELFNDMRVGHKEYVHPKVLLIEFLK